MYIGKQSVNISKRRERVYEVALTYPTFVRFFLNGSRVLSEDDKKILVEVHSKLFGRSTSWQGEGIKVPLKTIRFIQTKGMFKGLRARWSFVPKSSSETKVTICTSFKKRFLTSFGERLVGTLVVEKTTARILRELKRQVEESP